MDPQQICSLLVEEHEISKFKTTIGSTDVNDSKYLVDDVTVETVDETSDEESSEGTSDENESDDDYSYVHFDDEEDLEEAMIKATHAGVPKGITPEKLSKVWRIDLETAKRTIDVMSQNCARTENPEFSRNYTTNDRMLRYKRIKEHFFTDTFFATSKGGKSTRGRTCVQLFVTDKGFIHVIPMKRKGEVLQAFKQFAKEIGAPDAIICDAAKEQTSQDIRQFCDEMGITLRVPAV